MTGVGATLIALTLHACALARVRDVTDAMLIAATGAAWLGLPSVIDDGGFVTSAARIACGAVACPIALSRAWRRTPELSAVKRARRIGRSTPAALANSYALVLLRGQGAMLARAGFILATGMAWISLAIRNDAAVGGERSVLRFAVSAWSPICILAAATPLGAILRAESAAEWVLEVCGTTIRQRRVATCGLLVVAGGTVGLVAAVSLGAAVGSDFLLRFELAAIFMVTGAILSGLTEACFRWTTDQGGRDAGRLVLAIGALIACAEAVVWLLPF